MYCSWFLRRFLQDIDGVVWPKRLFLQGAVLPNSWKLWVSAQTSSGVVWIEIWSLIRGKRGKWLPFGFTWLFGITNTNVLGACLGSFWVSIWERRQCQCSMFWLPHNRWLPPSRPATAHPRRSPAHHASESWVGAPLVWKGKPKGPSKPFWGGPLSQMTRRSIFWKNLISGVWVFAGGFSNPIRRAPRLG